MRLATDHQTTAWQPMTHGGTACDFSPHSLALGREPLSHQQRAWPWRQPEDFEQLVTALRPAGPETVQVARERLARPLDLGSRDPILDYWIGLEALVLPRDSGELGFRAAIRLAYLCASEPDDRKRIFNETKASYNVRSRVIHGSRVDAEKRNGGTEAARRVLRLALRAFVLGNMRERDLDDLVLGITPPANRPVSCGAALR